MLNVIYLEIHMNGVNQVCPTPTGFKMSKLTVKRLLIELKIFINSNFCAI